MDLKTFATLALLGYTNAAAPSGVRNAMWPAWETAGRVTLPTTGVANTFTTTLVGAYPVGCIRSVGLARFSQNVDGNNGTIADRKAINSTANKTFYGSTVAHTGTFIGGAGAIDATPVYTSSAGTFPAAGTVSWACCTDAVGSMTPVFCAAAVDPAVKVYSGALWFSQSNMVTATTGLFFNITPTTGSVT